ncbi:hypothetical protein KQ905_15035, partial [Listeria monocytogenes]|nr:hypothetical protein [Listeria monocytogenes]
LRMTALARAMTWIPPLRGSSIRLSLSTLITFLGNGRAAAFGLTAECTGSSLAGQRLFIFCNHKCIILWFY